MILVVTTISKRTEWQKAFGMKKHERGNAVANIWYKELGMSKLYGMFYDVALIDFEAGESISIDQSTHLEYHAKEIRYLEKK